MLGYTYKDRITGFQGVATGYCQYLSGCNQLLLVPKAAKDGAYKAGEWFDVQRLEQLRADRVVLDNGPTPGPDRPAPKR